MTLSHLSSPLLLLIISIISLVAVAVASTTTTTPPHFHHHDDDDTSSSSSNDMPIPGKGIQKPDSYYQRSRHNKYPSQKPYYHWYYFWLRNETHHYALCYQVAYGGKYEGMYNLLAERVPSDSAGNSSPANHDLIHRQQLYRSPVDSLKLSESYLHFDASESGFQVQMPKDSDMIHLTGRMHQNDSRYFAGNEHVDAHWDIQLERIYGYYGQDAFEWFDEHWSPIIQWNTYGHFSKPTGRLNIRGEDIILDDSWVAYADMNWGGSFPAPPAGSHNDEYAWGWYRVAIPATDNVKNSFALIAGMGLTTTDSSVLKSMYGKFADVHFDASQHVSLRQITLRNGSVFETKASETNDGKVLQFDIDRSDWVSIQDEYGEARFPLTQILTMETSTYLFHLKFTSTQDQYNRLLFPFNDFIFSDFEGLGVTCHLRIRDKKSGEMVRDEVVHTAGLEYGYKYDLKFPQQQQQQ